MNKTLKLNATAFVAILLLISACDKSKTENATTPAVTVSTGPIDAEGKFEKMLDEVDQLIGKKLKSTQTDTSVGGTYKFDGPIDKVLSVVDAYAKNAGFTATAAPSVPQQALQATGAAVNVSKAYKHPQVDMVTVTQSEISGGKFLSILLMRPTGMTH